MRRVPSESSACPQAVLTVSVAYHRNHLRATTRPLPQAVLTVSVAYHRNHLPATARPLPQAVLTSCLTRYPSYLIKLSAGTLANPAFKT